MPDGTIYDTSDEVNGTPSAYSSFTKVGPCLTISSPPYRAELVAVTLGDTDPVHATEAARDLAPAFGTAPISVDVLYRGSDVATVVGASLARESDIGVTPVPTCGFGGFPGADNVTTSPSDPVEFVENIVDLVARKDANMY